MNKNLFLALCVCSLSAGGLSACGKDTGSSNTTDSGSETSSSPGQNIRTDEKTGSAAENGSNPQSSGICTESLADIYPAGAIHKYQTTTTMARLPQPQRSTETYQVLSSSQDEAELQMQMALSSPVSMPARKWTIRRADFEAACNRQGNGQIPPEVADRIEEYKVIDSGTRQVTVPAGTFTANYIKVKIKYKKGPAGLEESEMEMWTETSLLRFGVLGVIQSKTTSKGPMGETKQEKVLIERQ